MFDGVKKKFQRVFDKMEDAIINDEKPVLKPKGQATIVDMDEPLEIFPKEQDI